ncbi:MAG: DUF4203 domain-containing protein [Anaerolineales bacterium]|nr:DUF4203 domain-containing protein [Anaerolineales bacterium]
MNFPIHAQQRFSRYPISHWISPLIGAVAALLLTGCSAGEAVSWNPITTLENLGPAQGSLKIVGLLGGILLLVAGWRIYRVVIALPGFLLVAALATTFMDKLVENDWISLALVGVLGLIGAWLALKLHDIAIFIIGAVGGGYLAFSLWPTFTGTEPTIFIIAGGIILGGAIMLLFGKLWMVLFSAAAGAIMFVWGLGSYTALFIPLFLAGILVQYGSSSSQKRVQTYGET